MRVLVIGATGSHGGSVARELLGCRCYALRAMTRRPSSLPAVRLHDLGVEIVRGDLDDRPSLRAALEGCAGVFAWLESSQDVERCSRRGRNLINAVAGSEVDFVVFGTIWTASGPDGHDLEAYARSLELPATFIRLDPRHDADALAALVTPMFEDPGSFVGRTLET
jgi:uncharacterized protein YbjT (DUF2867 family)